VADGLAPRIKHALDEGRILILGSQVLLGFQFRAVFEPRFDALPEPAHALSLAGPGLLVLTVGVLLWPAAAYHRIVARGEATRDLHDFITALMNWALFPLALSLGSGLISSSPRRGLLRVRLPSPSGWVGRRWRSCGGMDCNGWCAPCVARDPGGRPWPRPSGPVSSERSRKC
jgi:hypothetical protein